MNNRVPSPHEIRTPNPRLLREIAADSWESATASGADERSLYPLGYQHPVEAVLLASRARALPRPDEVMSAAPVDIDSMAGPSPEYRAARVRNAARSAEQAGIVKAMNL